MRFARPLLAFLPLFLLAAEAIPGATLAAGDRHSLGLKDDGTVWSWGDNSHGQLGDGTTRSSDVPLQVEGLSAIVAVAAGGHFSLALDELGHVYAWGDNSIGQLGSGGASKGRTRPHKVEGIAEITAIAAGHGFALAKRNDGTVWTWGGSAAGRAQPSPVRLATTEPLSDIVAIAAGRAHALAVSADGSVWAWGSNASGQLGTGGGSATAGHPLTVLASSGGALSGVASVAAGADSSYALTLGGELFSWGGNSLGELGDGTTSPRDRAVRVVAAEGDGFLTEVADVAAGPHHALAIQEDGALWTWGADRRGRSASDTIPTARSRPMRVRDEQGSGFLDDIMAVAGGDAHSLAVQAGRPSVAWAWGANESGQLGTGTTEDTDAPRQVAEVGFVWMVRTPRPDPISGIYSSPQRIDFTSRTPESTIRVTAGDAPLDPDVHDPTLPAGQTVSIEESQTVKARAWADGLAPSAVSQSSFKLRVAAPVTSVASGLFSTAQRVRLETATLGADIRFTTDGAEPRADSPLYVEPIAVTTATRLRARAFKTGWEPSELAEATYRFDYGKLPEPRFEPPSGTYETSARVTLASHEGATIRFTLDGTEPTESSDIFAGPIQLVASQVVRAAAFHPDWRASSVARADYKLRVAAPRFDPPGGAIAAGVRVRIASSTPGALVHYTTDRRSPTPADSVAGAEGLTLSGFTRVRAIAFKPGLEASPVSFGDFQAVLEGSSIVSECFDSGASVDAGNRFAVVLRDDGSLWAWGDNQYGMLGDGTTSDRRLPVPVGTLSSMTSISIFGSGSHSLALKSDGTVWSWGRNNSGQLGDGTTTDRWSPVQVSGLTNVTAISAGFSHNLALKADGTVWSWGLNTVGELGDGSTTQRLTPVQVSGLSNVSDIFAGSGTSKAISADGTFWGWGALLGDGTSGTSTTPIESTINDDVAEVGAGGGHALARLANGIGIWAWGSNASGQLGDGSTTIRTWPVAVSGLTSVIAVESGQSSSAATRIDGSIWGWGENGGGELGDGTTTDRLAPVALSGLPAFSHLSFGGNFGLALDPDCTIWAWGGNDQGQLGDGTYLERLTPAPVTDADLVWRVGAPTFSPAPPQSPDVGSGTSVTMTTITSGASIRYTLDGSEPTVTSTLYGAPVPIVGTSTFRARAFKSGSPDSVVSQVTYTYQVATPSFTPGGGTYSSIQNVTIQTATPDTTIRYTLDGTNPTTSSPIYSSPVAILETKTLKAKAYRADRLESAVPTSVYTINLGTLTPPVIDPGTGTYVSSQTATLSAEPGATIRYTLDGTTPTATSAEYTAPLSIEATKTIKAAAFRLGYVTSTTSTAVYTIKVATPTFTPGAGNYTAGQRTTVATATAGATIHYTITGATPATTDRTIASSPPIVLGNYTLKAMAVKTGCSNSDVATAAFTISGNVASAVPSAASVSGGASFSLALAPGGEAWSWGRNNFGQLGDNSTTQRTIPVQVSNDAGTGFLTGISAVSAGLEHGVALKSDGTVWAWGRNNNGQLGDNTNTQRNRPVQVKGPGGVGFLSGVVAIGADYYGSTALKSDGTVWAWGDGGYGQLGQNSTADNWTPVQVKGVGGTGFLTGIVAISVDHALTFALSGDGRVYSWGYNGNGQLGDGTTTNRLAPIVIPGLTGITAVAVGDLQSMVRDSDSGAWAWGRNTHGQVGDGTNTHRFSAVQVVGITNAAWLAGDGDAFSNAAAHSFTVNADGTLWAWGRNTEGQLGDGTTTDRWTAVQTQGLPTIARVDAGNYHTLAIGTDASVWAWGYNGYGQLGIGSVVTPSILPVRIFEPGFGLRAAAPTLSHASGTYTATFNATLASATVGASIRYTLDGTEPTSGSTQYTAAIPIGSSLTLKAKAFKAGQGDSPTSTAVYTLRVATPTLNPGTGTYTNVGPNVVVSCSTAAVTIHYTTNGVDPTTSDPTVASGSTVPVPQSLSLKAKAWKSGWTESLVVTGGYTVKVAAPTFTPPAGSYSGAQTVTASTATSGATLRFTTSGVEPTSSSPVFPPTGLLVDRSLTLRVAGFKTDFAQSDTTLGTYVVGFGTVATPSFVPAPGTYAAAQLVSLSSGTAGATIRFTLDGSDPTIRSTVYDLPIPVDGDSTIKARAFKADWTGSSTATGTYTVTNGAVAAPVFSKPGGRYTSLGTVVLTSATAGAEIRYTSNGTDPTATSTLYATPISVPASVTIKARAFKTGMTDSPVRRADYWLTGELSTGFDFSLALKSDGTVWAWGENGNKQLGNGGTTDSWVPIQVPALTDVVGIAAGDFYALALKRDGTVWTWGQSLPGTPTQIASLSNVAAIAAGYAYRTAVKNDGTVWTWDSAAGTPAQLSSLSGIGLAANGSAHRLVIKTDGATAGTIWGWGTNTSGQLGDGTTTNRTTPVAGLTDAVGISAAGVFSMAVRADGSAWTWGYSIDGAVGNGSTGMQSSPFSPNLPSGIASIRAGEYDSYFVGPGGRLWGSGKNTLGNLGTGSSVSHTWPIAITNLAEVLHLAAKSNHVVAALEDLRVYSWAHNASGKLGDGTTTTRYVPVIPSGFLLGDNSWLVLDSDQDGLRNHRELALRLDLLNADTNGDGIPDGAQVGAGQDARDPDMDDDGVSNATERANGTDPFRADTDGDGTGDLADCFPLDPTRSTCPPPVPGDTTPPTITLTEPTNAQLISSNP